MEDQIPVFHSRKTKQTFAQWHTVRQLPLDASDQSYPVYMEKSLRSSMKPGIVVGWHIEFMADDYNGIGKYMNVKSYALIQHDSHVEPWPLTMLYFDLSESDIQAEVEKQMLRVMDKDKKKLTNKTILPK